MSEVSNEDLQKKYGVFPKTWAALIDANNTKEEQRKKLSPTDFDEWCDWIEESRRKIENSMPGPSGN
jgi:hypothetical protein